jgi:hypothetical protein
MKSMNQDQPSLETLAEVIARSQILVARPAPRLPAGFDDVDVAILNWIAAEARLANRTFTMM